MGDQDQLAIQLAQKIVAPILWSTQQDFFIQDYHKDYYDEVVNLIKHHYFRNEPMCRSKRLLQDPVSVNGYLELINFWLKDETSIIALSAKSHRVVGVAITKPNYLAERSDIYSREQLYEGEALAAINHLKCGVIKQSNFFHSKGISEFLRIYLLCVHPSYKAKGVGVELLETCKELALFLNFPFISGILTSHEHRMYADNAGYKLHSEIPYKNWMIDNQIVFDDPGIGNYSAAFMIKSTSNDKPNMKNF
ncbi:uncharacterized protein LOC106658306 [Trichogramma pretiosum]|uniref:uncharacterized protein LOC106658306 n=1 Tax=Trichogramma pretiosum TaxID=7493 RepID=UPI0006C98E44|nr:uncharacterized protein LOC106658306 [Trichogramma pretiosum]